MKFKVKSSFSLMLFVRTQRYIVGYGLTGLSIVKLQFEVYLFLCQETYYLILLMQKNEIPRVSFQYFTASSKRLLQTEESQTVKSRFSGLSSLQASMFSQNYSVKRVNEIKPKPKLTIPQGNSLKQLSQDHSKLSRSQIKKQSIKYDQIKSSLFSWRKYTPMCGIESRTGKNGCLCGNPCPLLKQWTRNYKQSDLKLYQQLLNQPIPQHQSVQIQKDILRTHSQCQTFTQNQRFQQMLEQVLRSYCVYDPQIGYVQGMNLIVGTILYHLKNSELTFWAFVDLMDQQQLRMIYLPRFQFLKVHQEIILTIMDEKVNDLVQKMDQLDILPASFLSGWILSLMGNCIPLQYMHHVTDRFRKYGWNYIYQLIITYLLYLKQPLLQAQDDSQFLVNLNTKTSRQYGIVWEELVKSAQNFPLSSQSGHKS